jgi:hypothetical protein
VTPPEEDEFAIGPLPMDLEDPGDSAGSESAKPQAEPVKFFSLPITTPSGPPWEQSAAAALSARLAAPIDISQLEYRIRRVAPWRLNQPGRFSVVYVRRADVRERVAIRTEQDGHTFEVVFANGASARSDGRSSALTAGLMICAVLTLTVVGWSALGRRAKSEESLRSLERQATLVETRTRDYAAAKRQAAELDSLGMRDHSLQSALEDIAWASRARDPKADITELEWTPDHMRVTAATPLPFVATDRTVHRDQDGSWLIDGREAAP